MMRKVEWANKLKDETRFMSAYGRTLLMLQCTGTSQRAFRGRLSE